MSVTRRQFMTGSMSCALGALTGIPPAFAKATNDAPRCAIQQLTRGPNHHFFGYYGKSVSHFDRRNDKEIVATFNLRGRGAVHVLLTDGRGDYQPLGGGRLNFDGHCTFSPNQQWLATDRGNSRKLTRSLLVYNMQCEECTTLAELDMKDKQFLSGDLRCDFHPRWSRTSDALCFDAIDPAGTRQIHVAHLQFPGK